MTKDIWKEDGRLSRHFLCCCSLCVFFIENVSYAKCLIVFFFVSVDSIAAWGESRALHSKSPLQNNIRGNVRYIWQIRSHSPNPDVSNLFFHRSEFLYIFMFFFVVLVLLFCFSGNTPDTRGTAFVVYEDIFDAKNACDHLSGFNVCNRYLVVLYYQSNKAFKRVDVDKKQEELNNIKSKYNISTDDLKK